MMQESGGGLHIDSDWKAEAAREKERLAEQEAKSSQGREATGQGRSGPAGFLDIVNLIAMQAAISLGGYQGPGGERIPPNLATAKHHIDLLDVLDQKTTGHLTEDEKKVLDRLLYELRLQYVQIVSAATGIGSGRPPA